jgi:N-acetylglucosamine-6-phosphate deacetylase
MKQAWTIKNGTLMTPFETIPKGVVVFRDGKILAVGRAAEVKIPKKATVIDACNRIIAPGLIDIHVHGAKGRDLMEASYEAINQLAVFLTRHGTTSFLPTTVSASRSALLNVARVIRTAMKKGTDGAEVLGVHLEGSYISPQRSGAQDLSFIRLPSLDEFDEIWEASEGTVKIVTLAPEIRGADRLLAKLHGLGIVASVGHSNATYSEIEEAIKHGVQHVAHTFNAMRGFHHREPGVVGAVLVRDELTAELICDNVHVHPAAVKLLVKAKGPGKVVLVTDAIQPTGMPDGSYKMRKRDVTVTNGVCRFESGELAGSTLTMNKAVRNVMKSVGIPLQTAIRMGTINPAVVANVDQWKGSLEPGKDADIVIIDDDVNVFMTLVKGKLVYQRD